MELITPTVEGQPEPVPVPATASTGRGKKTKPAADRPKSAAATPPKLTVGEAKALVVHRIFEVMKQVKSVKRDGLNDEGGWAYPTIDEYYLKCAHVAAKLGLSWILREKIPEHALCIEQTDPNARLNVRHIYYVDVLLRVDQGEHSFFMLVEDFSTLSVEGVYSGNQTAGTVMSMAEKTWMRMAFKIISGEPDGDSDKFNQGQRAQQPDNFFPA